MASGSPVPFQPAYGFLLDCRLLTTRLLPGVLPLALGAKPKVFCHQLQEIVMNQDRMEGNWKQVKGKVKEQWGKLTDDDLDVIAGKRDQLLGRIQQRHGLAKDEAERQVR